MTAWQKLPDTWKIALALFGAAGMGAATASLFALPKEVRDHSKRLVIVEQRQDALESMMQTWLCLEVNDRTGHEAEWRSCIKQTVDDGMRLR